MGRDPNTRPWYATQGTAGLALTTPALVRAAGGLSFAGPGIRHKITGLQASNVHATKPVHFTILDGIRTPVNFGTVADNTALSALTGMEAGDIAYRLDNTTWYYYVAAWTTCGAHVPVTLPSVASAAALAALVGMGKGDTVYETDINVWYYYGTSWVVCGITGPNQIFTDYLPAVTASLPLIPLRIDFNPPLECSENTPLFVQIDDTATVFWNMQGYDEPNV